MTPTAFHRIASVPRTLEAPVTKAMTSKTVATMAPNGHDRRHSVPHVNHLPGAVCPKATAVVLGHHISERLATRSKAVSVDFL